MVTLGPSLLDVGSFEGREKGSVARFFIVYGRVPLFFYMLQWLTTHTLAVVAGKLAGKPTEYLFGNLFLSGPPASGAGFGLGVTYALWILGVLMLYPLCKWYGNLKARRRDWWLSYI